MQTIQQAQHVIVLLRQNEKLAKEVAQLKRLNQVGDFLLFKWDVSCPIIFFVHNLFIWDNSVFFYN